MIKRAVAPDASARVQEVVELTLQGHTTTEIAHRTGMSHTAIRNIKQRADFREGFSLAMDERREAFRRKIDASVGAALATLIASMARADRWRDKNDAANSILDRAGLARVQKLEQAGTVTVQGPMMDLTPFQGRSEEELRHFIETGEFPDGSRPVAR